jgi:HEAT repeat protein
VADLSAHRIFLRRETKQMKTTALKGILLAWLLTLTVTGLRASSEQELIAALQSAASAQQKSAVCQSLSLIGTSKAVPALALLLADERLSQAARHALEALPYPEAGSALSHALGQTSGLLKAGVIDSLGWRGDEASAPLLTPLLSDADAVVAAAAATALGRIGGRDAIAALVTALDHGPAPARAAVQQGLLQCSEHLAASNDNAGAAAICRRLLGGTAPAHIRAGAWRGLVLSDAGQRMDLVLQALSGADRPIQSAALQLLRELDDPNLIQACVRQWPDLPAVSQLAVLEAQLKLGAGALATARMAIESPDIALRVGGWQALGELSDPKSVSALAKAAATGEPSEREAARVSLERLRGSSAREALLNHIDIASAAEKAELLRVLGERGDRAAVQVMAQHAASHVQEARLAALESLRRLAPPEALTPLLDIAASSRTDDEREPALRALYAVCQASPNKEQAARSIVQAMSRFHPAERHHILPLLSELATTDALAAVQNACRDPDPEFAKEAVRALAQWPNAAPAAHLLQLARASADRTLQTLALRGAITVAGHEPETSKRLALLRQALAAAQAPEEKKQALGQIGHVPAREALDLSLDHLADPALTDEACLAAVSIAEKLAASNPNLADEVAVKVLALVKNPEVTRRAWALRIKPDSAAPFIRDWLVSGPYSRSGVAGAAGLFAISFAPENGTTKVEWRTVPPADNVNLSQLFPGAENCAAYLQTRILAPQEVLGVLLMGSDDGIKAWLNGEVVHSNNVDRGMVVDQDAALIQLKEGTNELMLKITQGGGGWSACARIVGLDGKPIPGLSIERPAADATP